MKSLFKLTSVCSLIFIFLISAAHAQDTLKVMASGSQSTPPTATNGTGIFTVIKAQDSLTVKGDFEELSSYYTGAYIQMAEKGEQGNVLFTLSASNLNEEHTAGRFKAKDNTFHLNKTLDQYYQKGMLYINIATNDHGQGEIRAQIVP